MFDSPEDARQRDKFPPRERDFIRPRGRDDFGDNRFGWIMKSYIIHISINFQNETRWPIKRLWWWV